MEDHRNVEPAVYNDRRLIEHPIPMSTRQFNPNDAFDEIFNSETDAETSGDVNHETSVVNDEISSHSEARDRTTSDGEGIQHDTDNSIENVSIENGHGNNDEEATTEIDATANHDESDPLASSVGNDLEIDLLDMIDGSGTAQNEQNQTEATISDAGESDTRADVSSAAAVPNAVAVSNVVAVKLESLPVYDNHVANNNDIDDVLNEPVEDVHDDVVIVIGRSGIPKPLGMTAEQTIKRENDKMSGNITYSVSVRIHFIIKNITNQHELYQSDYTFF